ncbi:MAG: hypothetical protein ACPGQL_07855 [Thermoplasmatota archaeon]
MSMPSIAIASLLVIASVGLVAMPAAAIPEPDVGCGGDVVEICTPVCVTDPCPQYVCVHTRPASVCHTL